MGVEFEPLSSRWQQDPYPVYRRLRDEAPVHFAPESDGYVLSRYDDVVNALKTPDVFSSRNDPRRQMPGPEVGMLAQVRLAITLMMRFRVPPWKAGKQRFLVAEDGESHAVMRAIVSRGFTPRRIARWEARAHELAAEGVARLRSGAPFDLVHDLAVPLPVTIIAEMIGVESSRMRDFKRWSDAFISGGTGSRTKEGRDRLFAAMGELRDYLSPIVAARRKSPQDDLISVLVTGEDQAGLADFELFLFVFLLLLAGNETTTNLLGNTVDALLIHPEQLAAVEANLDLVPSLIEEALRWDSPVQMIQRTLRKEVTLHGTTMPVGAQVSLMLGAANRDERHFPDPDRFDVTRDAGGHLAFGLGAHFCLGSALARLEARAALEALVPELSSYARARPEREFVDSFVVRGLTHLELRAA